jgi:hypothetical protein
MSRLNPSTLTKITHSEIPCPTDRNTEMLWGWILENERVHGTQALVDIISTTELGQLIADRIRSLEIPTRRAAKVNHDD